MRALFCRTAKVASMWPVARTTLAVAQPQRLVHATRTFCTSFKAQNEEFGTVERDSDVESTDSKAPKRKDTTPSDVFGHLREDIISDEVKLDELTDEEVTKLPYVVKASFAGSPWLMAPSDITLPRYLPPSSPDSTNPSRDKQSYLYKTFKFDTEPKAKRFLARMTKLTRNEFARVSPVIVLHPKARAVTVGLPSETGLILPRTPVESRPADFESTQSMVIKYRKADTPTEEKERLISKLRSLVVAHGFTTLSDAFVMTINRTAEEVHELNKTDTPPRKRQYSASPRRTKKTAMAEEVKNIIGGADASASESGPSETSKSADDPSLPEAGTFVNQDGEAHSAQDHKDSSADTLQEHVPFPVPTAEEMGEKKPDTSS